MSRGATTTRRAFLARSAAVAAALASARPSAADDSGAAGRAVLVNHVGFAPGAAKYCLLSGKQGASFEVVNATTGRRVFRGRMAHVPGDLGDYAVGDFTAVREAGSYRIQAGAARSGPITVGADVYAGPVRKCIAYFSRQRCGDSKTGYHAPCHHDDGRRNDNGRRHDATGGWHDACDVRKWVNATLYGMTGLSRVLDRPPAGQDPLQILEELRWGNQYFLKMQEPAGYLMEYCGGNDGNRFTDNRPDTPDDRPVQTRVCELSAQFHFVAVQAAMVRHLRSADPQSAAACEAAARQCFKWCTDGKRNHTSTSLAAAVLACVEMHRASGADGWDARAAGFAQQLIELQHRDAPVAGLFLRSRQRHEPAREIMHGNLPLLALGALLEQFGRHADAAEWRGALRLHADYLAALAQRSAFGTVPYGVYFDFDPGGGRRVGEHWYRWFMPPHNENPSSPDWWVGVNAHLASNGIGLLRASRLLDDPALAALAQRQLDWIVGANPFNASTVTGVGSGQPRLFVTREFEPPTPEIPGGVMNGLGGDDNDHVVALPGSYHTCEYWTPMVAYTMWLMDELGCAAR
jgi:hypothetical protein